MKMLLKNCENSFFTTKIRISFKQYNICKICYIHAVDMHNSNLCAKLQACNLNTFFARARGKIPNFCYYGGHIG